MLYLRADDTIVILPADKASATVVMETEDYHRKIEELLYPATYKCLSRDHTSTVLGRLMRLSSNLPWRLMRRLLSGFLRHYHLPFMDLQKYITQTFP